jgi:hypothetical protein
MNEVPDWMIDWSNEIPECQSCVEAAKVVDDLAQMVKQLARSLRKATPDNALPDKALDYLKRKGLTKINLSRKLDEN